MNKTWNSEWEQREPSWVARLGPMLLPLHKTRQLHALSQTWTNSLKLHNFIELHPIFLLCVFLSGITSCDYTSIWLAVLNMFSPINALMTIINDYKPLQAIMNQSIMKQSISFKINHHVNYCTKPLLSANYCNIFTILITQWLVFHQYQPSLSLNHWFFTNMNLHLEIISLKLWWFHFTFSNHWWFHQ